MIERILQDYLTENAYPCYLSMPEHPSGSFCIIQKTGSDLRDGLFSATLAVQSYGKTKLETAQMNHKIVQTMLEAVTLPQISACDLNTDYDFPDVTRKLPRYQAIFDVTYYDD